MLDRRGFLALTGATALAACDRGKKKPTPEAVWAEKANDLVLLTDRPPNLEMPLKYLRHDLTPNDAFFVRWHLATLPATIDLKTFRLQVEGEVDRPMSLSLDELRKLPSTSIVAVNQCSGNSRAQFEPRVPGVQWNGGAVGNAKWTGVRLRDLLERAGVREGAIDVTFRGLDKPPVESVAAFVKSLSIARAREEDVLVAWAMNDAPLPMLNGFPLRLVVPGWYSTYWVKSLSEIRVVKQAFDGFWMAKAYRIPKTVDAGETPAELAKETVPISRLNVRSLIVRPEPGESVAAGAPYAMEGIAFDGGAGIERVEVSTDGGQSWQEAKLDASLGKYSFRRWRVSWTPSAKGAAAVMVRATSAAGEAQRATPIWNRWGYMRNVFERVEVKVT